MIWMTFKMFLPMQIFIDMLEELDSNILEYYEFILVKRVVKKEEIEGGK